MKVFIARIREVNPIINAVVSERFEQALEEAKRADELVRTSTPSQLAKEKPLLGVPITTKESNSVEGIHNLHQRRVGDGASWKQREDALNTIFQDNAATSAQ